MIVPTYKGLDDPVRGKTIDAIQTAFGPDTQVVTVEATAAARGQGAVHCLTVLAPYSVSIFRDGLTSALRKQTELRLALDKKNQLLTTPRLIGSWSATRAGQSAAKITQLQVTAQFGEDSKVKLTVAGQGLSGTYKVIQDRLSWPIEMELEVEGGLSRTSMPSRDTGRIEWITDKSFRLVLSDGDTLVLRKVLELTELSTEGRELAVGTPSVGVLKDTDERDASGALVQAWALKGQAGEAVDINLHSDAFDAVVSIVGPGLTIPRLDDDSGGGRDARLTFDFPETGTYKLIVQAFDSDESGEFEIKVVSAPPIMETADWDEEPVAAFLAEVSLDKSILPFDKPVDGELGAGAPEAPNGHLLRGWRIEPCGGKRLRIEVNSETFDTVLLVRDTTSGDRYFNDDEGFPGDRTSAIEFDCLAEREYKVFVSSYEPGATGKFVVKGSVLK